MSSTPFAAARLAAICRDRAVPLAEAFTRCFGRPAEMIAGEPAALGRLPEGLSGPGLTVRIGTAEGGMVVLAPACLLPDWYATPDENQAPRLAELAVEWAFVLLPEDAEADVTEAKAVDDLAAAAVSFGSDSWAELISLSFGDGSGAIHLLTPVSRLALLAAAIEPMRPPGPSGHGSAPPPRLSEDAPRQRLGRLRNVPVQVVVRLAEKKVEMGQVVSIAPGALITFGKNCEELLDLYVNNRLYCRGEAVKIGEHFGLKINEVGAVRVREERVF